MGISFRGLKISKHYAIAKEDRKEDRKLLIEEGVSGRITD